ncbi:MAG: GAF domain-containing protein, partial [Elainellaceae cyanobacterium]
FIEQVLLAHIPQQIVIFIDEIDSVSSLPFKEDFFALIRACYNERADNPDFKRLTFGLIGSAAPSDFIQDKTRTPFNIGRAINLSGFTFDEAAKLAQGIVDKADNPQAVLQEVLDWTGGQPFLTQKLCKIVKIYSPRIYFGQEKSQVSCLVENHITRNWNVQDEPEHLRTIRDRVLNAERQTSQLLSLYEKILRDGSVPATQNSEQMALQFSGLVVKRQGQLNIYNRIYRSVFNQDWLRQEFRSVKPYSDAIYAWQISSKDNCYLLRGIELQQSLLWAIGKSLSSLDYEFLTVSQERQAREFQEDVNKLHQVIAEVGYWNSELQEERENGQDKPLAHESQKSAFQRLQQLVSHMSPTSFRGIIPTLEKNFSLISQTLSMVDEIIDSGEIGTEFYRIIELIAMKISEFLNADRTSIFLLNVDADELWSVAAEGENGSWEKICVRLGKGVAGQVAQTKKIANIPFDFYSDTRSSMARVFDHRMGYRTYTMVAVPLLNEQQDLIAVVQILNKLKPKVDPLLPLCERIDKRGFNESDITSFLGFAPSIQSALESFQFLYKTAQKQQAAKALMRSIQSLSQSNFDLDKTLACIIDEAKRLMNADRSTLWLIDKTRQQLWTKLPSVDGVMQEHRIPIGAGFVGQVATTAQPLNVLFDLYDRSNSDTARQTDRKTGYRTCSLLCMPVFSPHGELLAVTQLVNKKRYGHPSAYDPTQWPKVPDCWKASFNPTDLEFMVAFNIQVGIALQNA